MKIHTFVFDMLCAEVLEGLRAALYEAVAGLALSAVHHDVHLGICQVSTVEGQAKVQVWRPGNFCQALQVLEGRVKAALTTWTPNGLVFHVSRSSVAQTLALRSGRSCLPSTSSRVAQTRNTRFTMLWH